MFRIAPETELIEQVFAGDLYIFDAAGAFGHTLFELTGVGIEEIEEGLEFHARILDAGQLERGHVERRALVTVEQDSLECFHLLLE